MFGKSFLMGAVGLMGVGLAQHAAATTCNPTDFCRSDTVTNVGGTATVTGTGNADNGPAGTTISYSLGNAFGPGQTILGQDFTTAQTNGQLAPGSSPRTAAGISTTTSDSASLRPVRLPIRQSSL